jgi:hypothetical protein
MSSLIVLRRNVRTKKDRASKSTHLKRRLSAVCSYNEIVYVLIYLDNLLTASDYSRESSKAPSSRSVKWILFGMFSFLFHNAKYLRNLHPFRDGRDCFNSSHNILLKLWINLFLRIWHFVSVFRLIVGVCVDYRQIYLRYHVPMQMCFVMHVR